MMMMMIGLGVQQRQPGMCPWCGGHMTWAGGWFMWVFWLALLALLVVLVWRLVPRARDGRGESAEEILRRRYARGEIDDEKFQRMLRELRER